MTPEEELQSFAGGIHGALAVGHALAAVWNYRRGNWWQATLHVLICLFEVWASKQHGSKDEKAV